MRNNFSVKNKKSKRQLIFILSAKLFSVLDILPFDSQKVDFILETRTNNKKIMNT